MHKFTEEQVSYIKENAPGTINKDLTAMFNNHFNLNLSQLQIENCKGRNNISSGLSGRFEKGHVPANKGTKGMSKANRTSFIKGNVPVQYRLVGSERIDVDGYLYVKVKEPNKWRMKHVMIYEEVYGPVPKSHCLVFADGDKQNIHLNNLILVSRAELLILNRRGLITKDSELTKTSALLAKVIDTANKKRRNEVEK